MPRYPRALSKTQIYHVILGGMSKKAYLPSVVRRYIHNNPAKTGLCFAEIYKWSSVRLYINYEAGLKRIPKYKDNTFAVRKFIEFSSEPRQQIIFG